MAIIKCPECGKEVSDKAKTCIHCGAPLNGNGNKVTTNNEKSIEVAKKDEKKESIFQTKKKPLIIFGVVIVLVVALIIGLNMHNNSRANFNVLFKDWSQEDWCDIATDGKSMRIDTRPDNNDYVQSDAQDAVEEANKKLGFKDSLYEKMWKSNPFLGGSGDTLQTDTSDKYKVTWTFEDYGLVVIYEYK